MMECPACGARNSDGSTFCIRCGTRFSPAREAVVLGPPPVAQAGAIVDEAAELLAAGRLDDAAAACRRALDEDPDLVSARSMLGMVEEERGNLAEALAEFEAVIRLAPERTAEREHADRLRPLVMAQVAPAVPEDVEDGLRHRRWIAAAIGGGVLLLVLIVGALVSGTNRGTTAANVAGGEPVNLSPNNAAVSGVAQPTAAGAANGVMVQADNLLAGPAIGQIPQDQTALQPSQAGGGRSGGGSTPPPVSSMDTVPIPPPTVPRTGAGGPIVPPTTGGSAATPPTGNDGAGQSPAPAVEQPRGRVRIWMGEPGTGTVAPAGSSVTGMSLGQSVSGGNALRATGQGSSGAAPIAGAPRGSYPAATATGSAAPRTSSGGTASSAAPRSGAASSAAQGGRPQLLSPPARGTAAGAVPMRSMGAGYSSGGTAAPVRTASASSPLRNQAPAANTPSGSSSHSASSSAADLRARAQSAMAAGRGSEARSLYAAAIAGYEADARRNPERSAASHSAAESCRRALEALGGGH